MTSKKPFQRLNKAKAAARNATATAMFPQALEGRMFEITFLPSNKPEIIRVKADNVEEAINKAKEEMAEQPRSANYAVHKVLWCIDETE